MDASRFDALARSLHAARSRRAAASALGGLALAGAFGWLRPHDAGAKKKRKKKKVKFNRFGCVNVGGFCKSAEQCCSGICDGKTCREHDSGGCKVGAQDGCVGSVVKYATSAGVCNKTTGNAPYCANDGQCTVCAKDADCVPFCGPGAACIVRGTCPETGGTTCFGPSVDSCVFPSGSV